MFSDDCQAELAAIFARHGATLAYLFGSQAEGHASALSDIDLAVWFAPGLTRAARLDAQLALMAACSRHLKRDDVDVVVLNDAPPLLLHEVARHGRLLYEDPATRPAIDFVVHAFNRYVDTQPFRRIQNRYLAERLQERRAAHDAES